ncbi:MAG: extracellular solute-binding protein [Solirubrobacterales bacterium]|nr:extracellular solute-binding protein [Solirubrobacterales bacterium]
MVVSDRNGEPREGEGEESSPAATLTRAQLIKGAAALGVGAIVGGCGSSSSSSSPTTSGATNGLPSGVVGGPTGFAGAERYQYGADTAAGRAVEGLKRLTSNGRKQITLNMRMWSGATGQLTVPFPKGAPAVAELLQKETGVKLNLVAIDPTTQIAKNLQTIATRDGSNHILVTSIEDNGDYAEAGLALKLDEFMNKYQPDWSNDYVGGPAQVAMMTQYGGSTYAVSMDGDYQVWGYRMDLFEDSNNQRDFKAKHGYDLAFPKTWSQHADVAAFFTQPNKKLYGSVDLKNPYWGYVNWMMRYVSAGSPNQQYFDQNAKPLIDSPAGIQATKEHVASMAWTYPDTLSKSWPEEYATMGAGGAAMGSFFSNVTKFITAGSPLDKGYGKYIRTTLPPGRMVNGKLVQRSVIYFNNQFVVNAFSDPSLHEAAYLVLQWLSSKHVFDWLTGNPAGYMDPNRVSALDDSLVRSSYKPYACDELKTIIPHTAPPILSIRGAREYTQALDNNLQKALTKQITPEQAMSQTAASWEAITNRIGRQKQIAAIKASQPAWPTA